VPISQLPISGGHGGLHQLWGRLLLRERARKGSGRKLQGHRGLWRIEELRLVGVAAGKGAGRVGGGQGRVVGAYLLAEIRVEGCLHWHHLGIVWLWEHLVDNWGLLLLLLLLLLLWGKVEAVKGLRWLDGCCERRCEF